MREEVQDEARARYERAVALADQIRDQWLAEGAPLTTLGGATGQSVVPHPLVTMLARAERDANMFLRVLKPRQPVGRPVGNATAPDRAPRARGRLKAVEG